MNAEKRNKIKEILSKKPVKWMRILLDMWADPEKDLKKIGIANGLAPKTAGVSMNKIMNDPAFKAAMDVLMEAHEQKAEDRRAWWMRKMVKAVARCEIGVDKDGNETPHLIDDDGDFTGPMRDTQGFMKAMDLIGKAEQIFVIRKADGTPVIQFIQEL